MSGWLTLARSVESDKCYVAGFRLQVASRRIGHAMGFVIECTPAGQGRLDIPWLLGKLHDFGRDPNAILELWTPPVGTLPETIAREDAWAIESIQYSRRVIRGRKI